MFSNPKDEASLTRRHFMHRGSLGFGGLAMAGMLQKENAGTTPWAPKPTHSTASRCSTTSPGSVAP